jgi:hypothetical protein
MGNLNIQPRVFNKSMNAQKMQTNLGRDLSMVSSVTTAQVQKSNADREEAKKQKIRSAQFSKNEQAIMALLLDIARIEKDLVLAGYNTDAKIEALIQDGRIASAKYQKAILLQEKRGELGIAAHAAGYQLDAAKMMHKAGQNLQYLQHKYGLDIKLIDAVYAQKKTLATADHGKRLAQSNQRQLAMAAFKEEVKGLPGSSSSSQPILQGGGGGNWAGNSGGGGGFWSGLKKMFSFS